MKYFHSLIITGFLIPFLPINAEMAPTNTSQEEIANQNDEESSLTSLDEELALLDEEFEEFKEELYSLETELQKQENSQKTFEDLLKHDQVQKELVAQNEINADFEDTTAFNDLSPELDDQEMAAIEDSSYEQSSDIAFNDEQSDPSFSEELSSDEEQLHLAGSELSEDLIREEDLALDDQTIEEPGIKEEIAAEPDRSSKPIEAAARTPIIAQMPAPDLKKEMTKEAPAILNVQETASIGEPSPLNDEAISVDLKQAFSGSPIIYSLLLGMSVLALGIWFYSILSLRSSARVSADMLRNLQNRLNSNQFDEALSLCQGKGDLFSKMVLSGIHSRRHGLPIMIESMKAEGKRVSIAFWQKIGLLNDIAIIAPMLGLLGTVLGMFYAFYDVNRSIESISTLFDGLGISVGTTVAGLIVAILALILHSTAKYRLVRALALVENDAQSLATLIDDRTSLYKGS